MSAARPGWILGNCNISTTFLITGFSRVCMYVCTCVCAHACVCIILQMIQADSSRRRSINSLVLTQFQFILADLCRNVQKVPFLILTSTLTYNHTARSAIWSANHLLMSLGVQNAIILIISLIHWGLTMPITTLCLCLCCILQRSQPSPS